MKYLCLIYSDEKQWEKLSEPEMQGMMAEYMAFTASAQKSGHYLGGNPLEPTSTATTVRVRSGKLSTTDGPFAETKEQLGGYLLIDVRDLNDAVRIASKFPAAQYGSIEVRPLKENGCA